MRSAVVLLLVSLLGSPCVFAAGSDRPYFVPTEECLGFVIDSSPPLRGGDQITVNGVAVLDAGKHDRLLVNRERLLQQCAAGAGVVRIEILRVSALALR